MASRSSRPAEDLSYVPYSVAMANDTQTNDSQFFISLVDLTDGLERLYTIFGQVVSGTEVVDAIATVPVNDPRVGVPLELVTIESIVISGASEPAAFGRIGLLSAAKALCNVKETKPQEVLSKRNRRSILTVLFAQRFTTDRKAMGRLGLG